MSTGNSECDRKYLLSECEMATVVVDIFMN